MKLYEIATQEFDEVKFEKDCAFYLEQMGSQASSLRLYRGMSSDDSVINKIKPFRERTLTVSMPSVVHNELNEFFKKKFKHPFRNGLFAVGSKRVAGEYGEGDPKVIVPVGEFDWICNPDIPDLYEEYNSLLEEYDEEEAERQLLELVNESRKWKRNIDLPGCIQSNAEIMFWCPGGYYVFGQLSSATTPGFFLPSAIK